MTADRWTTFAGAVNSIEFNGKPSIELKQGNYAEHIQSGAALLNGLTFRNGTIEYNVASTTDTNGTPFAPSKPMRSTICSNPSATNDLNLL